MDRTSYELSVIAYYLSEYDEKAVSELGYKTRTEAFSDISYLLGRENNYRIRRVVISDNYFLFPVDTIYH